MHTGIRIVVSMFVNIFDFKLKEYLERMKTMHKVCWLSFVSVRFFSILYGLSLRFYLWRTFFAGEERLSFDFEVTLDLVPYVRPAFAFVSG